ncbi:hypothetical protein [Kitasatospora sp. NPDC088346]|uniref:hypothetical protein n=1 Tax=Kitasatospora sp. NPDC088346 TaxID=3364073 RepID=UPI003826A36B
MDLERDGAPDGDLDRDLDRDLDSELSRLFRESVDDLCAPPVVLMVSQATARGRTLRRRRRLAVAASALVAAALVGTVGMATVRHSRGPVVAAASATTAPGTASTPAAAPAPEPRSGPAADPAATPADGMLAVLSTLLPSGAYSNYAPAPGSPAAVGGFRVDFNDGRGPTTVVVSLTGMNGRAFGCPQVPALPGAATPPPDGCTQSVLDSGDPAVAYRNAPGESGLAGRTVAVRHEDGTVVLITSMNGTAHPADGGAARGTRPEPALDEERLAAMADDETWLQALSPQLIADGAAWRRAWA